MKKSEIYREAAKMVLETKMFVQTDIKLEILWELLKESDIQLMFEGHKEEREKNVQDSE
jgi:hypothetical protein